MKNLKTSDLEMNNNQKVANLILDLTDDSEFTASIESKEAVIAFASNKAQISLEPKEAEKVRQVCILYYNGSWDELETDPVSYHLSLLG